MNIRVATTQDSDEIKTVYLSAFPEAESEIVSGLANELLYEKTTPQTISLVAESEGAIAGHIAFSPVNVDNNDNMQGYILAPLGVRPDCQNRLVGSKLIEYGMRQLSILKVNIVFVYGDPGYYHRFGFSTDAARKYAAPYRLQYPAGWQAIVLNECGNEQLPAGVTCVPPLCNPELW